MANRAPYIAAKNSTSGAFTANDASSGVVTAGTLQTWNISPYRGLSANVSLSLYTIALAIRAKWQGSTDGSTWVDYVPENNAANVTIQSGTGVKSVSILAPPSVMSKPYARLGCYIVGGSTGTASDTYTLSYSYARKRHSPIE